MVKFRRISFKPMLENNFMLSNDIEYSIQKFVQKKMKT